MAFGGANHEQSPRHVNRSVEKAKRLLAEKSPVITSYDAQIHALQAFAQKERVNHEPEVLRTRLTVGSNLVRHRYEPTSVFTSENDLQMLRNYFELDILQESTNIIKRSRSKTGIGVQQLYDTSKLRSFGNNQSLVHERTLGIAKNTYVIAFKEMATDGTYKEVLLEGKTGLDGKTTKITVVIDSGVDIQKTTAVLLADGNVDDISVKNLKRSRRSSHTPLPSTLSVEGSIAA